jgi:uncharacterized protein YceK
MLASWTVEVALNFGTLGFVRWPNHKEPPLFSKPRSARTSRGPGLVLGLLLLSGCSTLISKSEPQSDFGIPYSGLGFHEDSWGYHLYLAIMGFPYGTVEFLLAVPFLVVDLGLSAAVDTLLLPIDLVVDAQKSDHKTPEEVFGPLH